MGDFWYKVWHGRHRPIYPPDVSTFISQLNLSPAIKQFPAVENKLAAWYERMRPDIQPYNVPHYDDESYPLYYDYYFSEAKQGLHTFEQSLPAYAQTEKPLFKTFFSPDQWETFIQPLRFIHLYYQFTPQDFAITVPFNIPKDSWFEGTWIVAPPGRGKTNLLQQLVLTIPEPNATVIIMDAKGDLLNTFNRMRDVKNELVYLEPNEEWPLAINPLEVGHSVEFLEYIFSALLETPMTPYQSTLFRMVLTLCKAVPNATLETFRQIVQHGPKGFEKELRTLKKRDQDFFDLEWKDRVYAERRPEVLARLRTLMTNPVLDAIFQSSRTKLDMGKLMDEGKVVCINNNYDLLGDQGCEMFGRLFIALVWAAARARSRLPDEKKRPVYFFIDEAHFVISRDTTIRKIINQCRAQKIAMFFAHQEIQDITNEDTKATLRNVGIKFASTNWNELAMPVTKEFPRTLPRGKMAAVVRDVADIAVEIAVPLADIFNRPKLTSSEYQDIVNRSRLAYCYLYEEQTYSQTEETTDRDANLYWKRTLSPKIALKGGAHIISVSADDLTEKKLKLTIKPNTKHGDKVRVKGYGGPKPGGRGDIIIEWIIPQRADQKTPYKPFTIPGPDREERW